MRTRHLLQPDLSVFKLALCSSCLFVVLQADLEDVD